MFILDSRNKLKFATNHQKLLVELWLEAVGLDTSAIYRPAICSTLQTLKNLLTTLNEVEKHVLRDYTIRELCEETIDRLDTCEWIQERYREDLVVVNEVLVKLREAHPLETKKAKKEVKAKGNDEVSDVEEQNAERSREQNRIAMRRIGTSVMKAFLAKIERDRPIQLQVDCIIRMVADEGTKYELISRAISEIVNDLIHCGHSRKYLHRWMYRTVLRVKDTRSFIERFEDARAFDQPLPGDCEVYFMISSEEPIPDVDRISFIDHLPVLENVSENSPFRATSRKYAKILMSKPMDIDSASEQAYRQLLRYLHSTRLDHLNPDRQVAHRSIVHRMDTGLGEELSDFHDLPYCQIHNDELFYAIPMGTRNEGTFAELDRVVYWLEQSRRWDDVRRLIALWTAMEFLFSKTTKAATESIQELLPVYLVPAYPREALLDFWKSIQHAKIKLDPELSVRLDVQERLDGPIRRVDFTKLFVECLGTVEINPIRVSVQNYPILLRKYHRIRQLDPTPQQDMPIRRLISRIESDLIYDIRFAFRARNTIVHDAAIQIVQIDRLIQRLDWMLCTTVDRLLYQFVKNPTLSLNDFHEINKQSYQKWKDRLKDKTKAVPHEDVVNPPQYCLVTK